jgi:muramidase (phage lysozyme)
MARIPGISRNLNAFLDMIAVSEGTAGIGDDGYNVLVGSSKTHPHLFHDYATHPRIVVDLGRIKSSAAGRYQILKGIFAHYQITLDLPDFSPVSQDKIAIRLIKECGALDEIEAGKIVRAIYLCRSRWASLPGAGYGQRENSMGRLLVAFKEAQGETA